VNSEVFDLLISYLLLVLLFSGFNPAMIKYSAFAVLTAFLFHELAHRFVARGYGYRAFYRRWDTGMLMALLIAVATKLLTGSTLIFAAVGAVQIYAPYDYNIEETFGKIALAGPLTNVLLGATFLLYVRFVSYSPLLAMAASINLWLAFFNLLPFPPLDGSKVVRWNAGIWALAIGISYVLYRLLM